MTYSHMMTITSHRMLVKDVYEMILEGDDARNITAPGQFINLRLTQQLTPFLRRPMSICDYNDHQIKMIYKVVGEGTKLMSQMKVGEELDCLTGLGNGFTDLSCQKALVIGGGLGVPPMYKTVKALLAAHCDVTVVLGFNSAQDAFYIDEFKDLTTTYVATMDGSLGMKGNVLDVVKAEGLTFDKYYACGPLKMLEALAVAYPENGYLSYEARMGCGFGACMGCSQKVKGGYKRICVEGPVLNASEVIIDG